MYDGILVPHKKKKKSKITRLKSNHFEIKVEPLRE